MTQFNDSILVQIKDPSCLAIDLGAGSGRLVLGGLVGDRWKLTEVARFKTPLKNVPASGYQQWELESIISEIESHLWKTLAVSKPTSIGVDSWGVDYILLDSELRQVGVPVCYRDNRTVGVMEEVHKRISREEIYRRTGIQFLPFNTLYQLAASVMQEQEWMATARHFLMIPDFLHYRLSGVLSNEYTNASTTQCCGLDGNWDGVLLDTIGVSRSLMIEPLRAGTLLGKGVGCATGLNVIVPATHDTASAVAGTPLEETSEAYISSGTWSLMGIESLVPIATAEALAMNFTNEGGFGQRFRVLKNIVGMWPLQRVCDEHAIRDVRALVQAAEEVEPWRSIVDVNDTELFNPTSMTDSIRIHCRTSCQPIPVSPAQLARCIFDSLALSYNQVKEQIEKLCGWNLSKIRIVGGGSQNRFLNQLCADACGLPVVAGPVEASLLGNLSIQMIALGRIADLNAARMMIRRSFMMHEYHPRASVPLNAIRRYEELCAAQKMKGKVCA